MGKGRIPRIIEQSSDSITFCPSKVVPMQVCPVLQSKGDFLTFPEMSQLSSVSQLATGSFVHTCLESSAGKHKLMIRPEDVWAAIYMQFSLYYYRNDGVKPQMIQLEVSRNCQQHELSRTLMNKLKDVHKGDPSLIDWVLPKFSTTTTKDLTIFCIMALGTWEDLNCGSDIDEEDQYEGLGGLPEVTVKGDFFDWKLLRRKLERLPTFDRGDRLLVRWYNSLVKILDKIIETVDGHPDFSWWNRMCHEPDVHGGSLDGKLGGWLTAFNSFDKNGDWVAHTRNHSRYPEVHFPDLLRGGLSMNVQVIQKHRITVTKRNLHLTAAMRSADISGESRRLSPRLSWFSEESTSKSCIRNFFCN
jgi:hypothetical protein